MSEYWRIEGVAEIKERVAAVANDLLTIDDTIYEQDVLFLLEVIKNLHTARDIYGKQITEILAINQKLREKANGATI